VDSEIKVAVSIVIRMVWGGEVDCRTERTKLLFFDIVHMKIVQSRFELVTNIVVMSGGRGFLAVFQMKFVGVMSTIAAVIGDKREKRGKKCVEWQL
jgi:hypothetical protein